MARRNERGGGDWKSRESFEPRNTPPSWSKGLTQDSEDVLEVCEAVKT